MPLIRAIALWAVMCVVAVLNGVAREIVLVPTLGAALARPVSAVTLALLILLAATLGIRWIGRLKAVQYWAIGALWVALTVGFEFAFGRLVARKTWAELSRPYDLSSPDPWLLVLVVLLAAPELAARLRSLRA